MQQSKKKEYLVQNSKLSQKHFIQTVQNLRLTRSQNALHFGMKMFKIASVSGDPPQTPLGQLTTLPRPLVVRGFLPSAIASSSIRHLHACFPTRTLSQIAELLDLCFRLPAPYSIPASAPYNYDLCVKLQNCRYLCSMNTPPHSCLWTLFTRHERNQKYLNIYLPL